MRSINNIAEVYSLKMEEIPIDETWNFPCNKENKMHSIHSYPAKFPAFITEKFINDYEARGFNADIVADVFCGCGTVSYETVRLGKHFWGCDINPVATLIAKVKSRTYDTETLNYYFNEILEQFKECKVDRNDEVYYNDRINYWFDVEHIDDLLKLRTSIKSIVDDFKYQDFFLCGFSNILKPCSRWLTKSIKPQVDPFKDPSDVIIAFSTQIKKMLKANMENMVKTDGLACIKQMNFLDFNDTLNVDLVITSPPYVTSYEYADLHQLSTLWLGYSDDYKTFRQGSIGSRYHHCDYSDNYQLINDVGKRVISNLYGKSHSQARAVSQYYLDMQQVVSKIYSMLKERGECLFVIGDTEYKGVEMENARHLMASLMDVGFKEVNICRRKISNKILSPYRDASGKFTKCTTNSRKIYAEEYIITVKKSIEILDCRDAFKMAEVCAYLLL